MMSLRVISSAADGLITSHWRCNHIVTRLYRETFEYKQFTALQEKKKKHFMPQNQIMQLSVSAL